MKKIKLIPLFFVVFVFCFLFFKGGEPIFANSSDKISGWSWSSTIGWTSFNCTNNASCATADYGVDIDTVTKNLNGYAWNSNVGWISFEESDTPPDSYVFAANCEGACNSANHCTACFNPDDGKIWGWAKVVSLGNDGWIKLRDEAASYGAYIDLSDNGKFKGWSWNGNGDSSGIGWLSFNCSNDSSCATSQYSVVLTGAHIPEVDNLTAPNWDFVDACTVTKGAVLSWDMQDADVGDTQTAYQIVINTSNTRSGALIDTGKRVSISEQYATTSPLLDYATSYYWWVRVWDSLGLASAWQQFYTGSGSSTLTDNISANLAISPEPQYTFTTYNNEFPDASFDYIPLEIMVGDIATFTDNSFVYDSSAPSTPMACNSSLCSWQWSAPVSATVFNPSSSLTPISFVYGDSFASLNVTDSYGYSCTSTVNFFVDVLPVWREIKPQ